MSEVATRNEQVARRVIELHNEHPEKLLDVMEELFDPELEWTPAIVGGLEGGTYRGYDGFRRYYAERGEIFREGDLDELGYETVGDDAVIAHVMSCGVGRASGATIEHEIWLVFRLRDGRVYREKACTSRAEA
ncbi:MAG TPA: nuclear transport factor 2 family protein, partial [Thermoleophilaceae bacterium]|nr:nuclear transport factor 2 family protein [Thermoleophilaceae bacterium]